MFEVNGDVWLVGRDGEDITIVDSTTGETIHTLLPPGRFGNVIKVGDEVWALVGTDNDGYEVAIYSQAS